jgi:hypothetical protein
VDEKHELLAKTLDEELNNVMKTKVERQPPKRGKMYLHLKFLNYFL